jgi:hypothetical protein
MRRTFLLCSLRQQQPWLGSRRFDDPWDHSSCVHVRRPGVRWGVGRRSQQRGCSSGSLQRGKVDYACAWEAAAPLHRLGNSAPSSGPSLFLRAAAVPSVCEVTGEATLCVLQGPWSMGTIGGICGIGDIGEAAKSVGQRGKYALEFSGTDRRSGTR